MWDVPGTENTGVYWNPHSHIETAPAGEDPQGDCTADPHPKPSLSEVLRNIFTPTSPLSWSTKPQQRWHFRNRVQVTPALNTALFQGHQTAQGGIPGGTAVFPSPTPSPMVLEHKFALVAPQSSSCVQLHRHSISGVTVDLASLFLQRRLKVIEQNLFLIKEIISHRAFFLF